MTLLRSILSVALFSGAALAGSAGDALEARVRALEAELGRLGKSFAAPTPIEVLSAGEYQDRTREELLALNGPGWLEAQRFLREALGIERTASLETTRATLARATLGRFGVFGAVGRGPRLVVDASRQEALSDAELVRALTVAWRISNDGPARLFGERRTQESVALRWSLLMGEGDLTTLALSEQRAQRDPRKLDASALGDDLPPAVAGARDDALVREQLRVGREFAIRRLRDLDWAGIASMHEQSPASTEQLLHPLKLHRDQPRSVALPEWPDELGLELVRDDVLGEMTLRALLLDAGVPAEEARLATIGWDGDRLQLLRDAEGRSAIVWRVVFDRIEDTAQFATAFQPRALGTTLPRGFALDWVRSDSVELALQLATLLDGLKPGLKGNREDQQSTVELERELAAAVDLSPRVEGGRWLLPRYQLSLPVPEGWRLETLAGQPFLVGPQIGTFKDNIGVAALDDQRGTTLADWLEKQKSVIENQPALNFVASERRQLGDREFGLVRYQGKIGNHYLDCTLLACILDGRPVVLTASIAKDNVEWLRPKVEAALLGARVGPVRPGDAR